MKRLFLFLLMLTCPSWAAIARVAATPAGVVHTSAGTTCANVATAGFGTATGQTIVVVVGMQPGASPTVSVADNATGGTNSYVRYLTGVDTASAHVEMFWAVNIARVNASGLVVTVTLPSQRHSCEFKAYTGVVTIGPDIGTTNTNSGSSALSGTITSAITSNNSWIVAGFAAANGSTTVSALTGTLDSSAASTGSTTPSSGLVSNSTALQGGSVTDAVTWGTSRAWVAVAVQMRSDMVNPTISPNGGSFNDDTAWSITDTDVGFKICWRTDGINPAASTPGTCDASNNTTAFGTVTATGTVFKFLATAAAWSNSGVVTSTAFTLTVGAVSSSPGAGTYTSSQTVTLSIATTTGATALYTTDGSTPSCPSTGTTYSSGFSVFVTSTVKAIGCKTNYVSSGVQSDLYTINPPRACAYGLPLLGVGCGSIPVIAFDSTSGVGGGAHGAGNISWSHTTTGSSVICWVCVLSNGTISSVTYNSVAMTEVGTGSTALGGFTIHVYYQAVGAGVGAKTVSVTTGTGTDQYGNSSSYTGAAQTGIPDKNLNNTDSGSPLTETIVTVANSSWLFMCNYDTGNSAQTAGAGTLLRASNTAYAGFKFWDSNAAETPAGSHSLVVNNPDGNQTMQIISFAPAPW